MRNAETTLALSRGCGTVSRSKALTWKDVSPSPRDDPMDGEHGAEESPGSSLLESRVRRKPHARFGGGRQNGAERQPR